MFVNCIEESCTEHSWPCLYCCGLNDAFQFSLSGLASLSTLLPLMPGNEFAVCGLGMLLVGREFFLFCDGACVRGKAAMTLCVTTSVTWAKSCQLRGARLLFRKLVGLGSAHQVHCVFLYTFLFLEKNVYELKMSLSPLQFR